MATETKVTAKGKKESTRNTEADLLGMGIKGHVLLVIRKAKALAAKSDNDYKGTAFEDVESSNINGVWYARVRPDGAYFKTDEKSAEFVNIRALAKSAKDDIFALKYTKPVKDLINAVVDLSMPASERALNMDVLKDVKL